MEQKPLNLIVNSGSFNRSAGDASTGLPFVMPNSGNLLLEFDNKTNPVATITGGISITWYEV